MQHRSTALLFVVWTSAGCGAEVLDFPDGGSFADGASTTTDTTPGVASDASDPTTPTLASDASYPTTTTLGVDRGLTIESLSEPEDVALCEWLDGEFDAISPDKAHSGTTVPSGYAGGPGIGCFGLLWTGLGVPDCVLNLRANPCAATVGTLADCIDDFVPAWLAALAGSHDCYGGSAACTAFRTASECSDILFQSGVPENFCAGALPIVPGEGPCSCEAGICDLP
jgi:hypothetical protein